VRARRRQLDRRPVSANRLARASIFMLAVPAGLLPSFSLSGLVAQAWGWRAAMIVAGVPATAAGTLRLAAQDARRAAGACPSARPPPSSASRPFDWIVVSGALLNFNLYVVSIFLPALLTRHITAGRWRRRLPGRDRTGRIVAGGLLSAAFGDRLAARPAAGC
jgi:hypothetical protein